MKKVYPIILLLLASTLLLFSVPSISSPNNPSKTLFSFPYVFASGASFGPDGNAQSTCSTSALTCVVSLSDTTLADLVIVEIALNSGSPNISSVTSSHVTYVDTSPGGTLLAMTEGSQQLWIFYGTASSVILSSESITVTRTSNGSSWNVIASAWAQTSAIFEQSTIRRSGVASTNSFLQTFTTSNANDILMSFYEQQGAGVFTNSSGNLLTGSTPVNPALDMQYKVVSTTQSNTIIQTTSTVTGTVTSIAFALEEQLPGVTVELLSSIPTINLSPSNEFTVSYMKSGVKTTGYVNASNTAFNFPSDISTLVNISAHSTAQVTVNGAPMDLCLEKTCSSGTSSTNSTQFIAYFELANDTTKYAIIGGGTPSSSPVLTYVAGPTVPTQSTSCATCTQVMTPLMTSSQKIYSFSKQVVTVSPTLTASGSNQQFITTTTAWEPGVVGAVPSTINYYHQYFLNNVDGLLITRTVNGSSSNTTSSTYVDGATTVRSYFGILNFNWTMNYVAFLYADPTTNFQIFSNASATNIVWTPQFNSLSMLTNSKSHVKLGYGNGYTFAGVHNNGTVISYASSGSYEDFNGSGASSNELVAYFTPGIFTQTTPTNSQNGGGGPPGGVTTTTAILNTTIISTTVPPNAVLEGSPPVNLFDEGLLAFFIVIGVVLVFAYAKKKS